MRRRDFIQRSAAASIATLGGVMPSVATALAAAGGKRHCILLWMSGGPSQVDTFDTKPDHENGGEFAEISTNVPGIRFSEHLPGMAKQADKLAIVRSLTSKEGDHDRGSYYLKTGVKQGGPRQSPAISSLLSRQLSTASDTLPPLVSIGGSYFSVARPVGPAFLGPRYQSLDVSVTTPAAVGESITEGTLTELTVQSLQPSLGMTAARRARRLELWQTIQGQFLAGRRDRGLQAHQSTYDNARALMSSQDASAFDISAEPEPLRRRYGVGTFGQGCLLARRLVQHGVACVEVTLDSGSLGTSNWDTHSENFTAVQKLSEELDAGWSTLLEDLADRGLLESTTVVWMGEFGRTPRINSNAGRDHFPRAFSAVLAGGGVAGGQVYGATSDDGMEIVDAPVAVPEFLATLTQATGINPWDTVLNESGRPVKIVDADPIDRLLA